MAKTTFLQDMNLPDLIERFGSNDKCRDYMEDLRWPDGPECPRCESKKASRIESRKQWECGSCSYQYSVTSGTLFHDSHLPLWKWFLAIYLVTESKKGISAKQLQRILGTKSYKTAWYLCHRIRAAMVDESGELLHGTVEADETYIGGKARGHAHQWDNKTPVVGVIQRGGKLRVRVMDDVTKDSTKAFLKEMVDDDAAAIYTDESYVYPDLNDYNTRHRRVNHSHKEYVRGDVHTNTVESAWSLFDRAVVGSYHKVSRKHLPAYLQEFEFRFNNRENPFLFRDTVLALIRGDALPMKELVGHRAQ
jgi:transposase-like protein